MNPTLDDLNAQPQEANGHLHPAPAEWVCLAAGLFLTIHYAWLMDDAFVYFRYIDNLLFLRLGLVYNAGEYVEGFSSPLWTLLLIPLRATGLDFWLITRLVGVLAFAVFWWLSVLVNRQLSPRGSSPANLPLCFLTFCYAVQCYFTSGLETPLVQVAAGVFALFVLAPQTPWLQIALALTPLVRPELALPCAMALGWSWWRRRRFPWLAAGVAASANAAWLAFRVYYYADLFPNTFYLKNTVDIAQGLIYVYDTARSYWLFPIVGAAVAVAVYLHRQPQNDPACSPRVRLAQRGVMAVMALVIAAYVVKIGGDPRHYRYLAFPICLTALACGGLVEAVLFRASPRHQGGLAAGAGLAFMVVAMVSYPRQLSSHPFWKRESHETRNKINDASVHRNDPTLAQPPWGRARNLVTPAQYAAHLDTHSGNVYDGLAGGFWCADIYRGFNLRWVHVLGLTEPVLARVNMPADRPAHKFGLVPLAGDIGRIVDAHGEPAPGMYRAAVERGTAPAWIVNNLATLEVIERKAFNRHDFGENLRLALTFPERITPPAIP